MPSSSKKISGLSVAGVGDGVASRPVHLRDTAQRVRIVDVQRIIGAQELAALQEAAEVSGTGHLPGMGANGVDARIERSRRAVKRLTAQRARHIRHLGHPLSACRDQHPDSGHERRAIGQSQALFGSEEQRLQAGPAQRLSAWQDLATVPRLALPYKHQPHVSQGSKVAAGPE